MILPPLFGIHTRYDDQEIKRLLLTYLSMDTCTYTVPTPKVITSYLALDTLSYNLQLPKAYVSFMAIDGLSYSARQSYAYVTYQSCDILSYEKPPSIPDAVDSIFIREKDSLGILSWNTPNKRKSNIIDYIVQYSDTGIINWLTYNDGISTNTGVNIPLTNNSGYIFRIAAVNGIGTGNFTTSSSIVPSGGQNNPCDIIFFADMDQSDRNQLSDYSCRPKNILVVTNGVTFDNNDGEYGSSWYYNGLLDTSASPSTYPHMRVSKCCNDDWSISGNFTISISIKPSGSSPQTINTIISSFSESGIGNTNSWKLYHYNNGIYFNINNTDIVAATGLSISTVNYTNITLCRSNNYLSMFIDGIEKIEKYYTNNISINSNYLIIGACHSSGYQYNITTGRGFTTEGFTGNIDEVIFSRSCFYRKNFTPSEYSTSIDCNCPQILSVEVVYDDTDIISWE